MKILFADSLLSAVQAMPAEIYDFRVLPEGGAIAGAPGSTIGWGYSIHNESTSLWLVTTGLDLGVFHHGTPNFLFDFPAVAPGDSVTVPFDQAGATGLAGLTWGSSAPPGFTNSGTFALTAQWSSGNPIGSGHFQFAAPDSDQPYSATVVPEPATVTLIALPLLWFGVAGGLGKRKEDTLKR
jgi:hypothetical protein